MNEYNTKSERREQKQRATRKMKVSGLSYVIMATTMIGKRASGERPACN